nr:hypothetical protein [Micromonospora sp. DSM 115978]
MLARDDGGQVSIEVASPCSDSARALELAGEVLPGGKLSGTATVVMQGRRGTVDDLHVSAQVATMAAELGKVPGVLLAVDPLNPAASVVLGTDPVSADRRTWITSVVLEESALEPDRARAQQIIDLARAYDGPDMQVEVAGPGATALNATNVSPGPLVAAAVAALLLLGVTLRSRFAVLVCGAVAGASAVFAVSVTVLLSGTFATSPFSLLLAGVVATATSLGGAVVVVHRTQSSLRRGSAPLAAAQAGL